LKKLGGNVVQGWQKTKGDLESGHWLGSKLSKLEGRDDYSCRVGGHHRAFFRHLGGDNFEATDIRTREQAYK
jgi:hypothetical protein